MKNIVFTIFFSGLVGMVFANDQYFLDEDVSAISNITSESTAVMEVRNTMLDFINSGLATNHPQARSITYNWRNALQNNWIPWEPLKEEKYKYSMSEISVIDKVFAANGITAIWPNCLPCCFSNGVQRAFPNNEVRQEISYQFGFLRLGYVSSNVLLKHYERVPTVEEVVILFPTDVYDVQTLKRWENLMTGTYLVAVKKHLRATGKSIMQTNGVNPIAPYMEKLVNSLNAPRFNGLEECFDDIGLVGIKVDYSKMWTAEEATRFKNRVLNDEEDLNSNLAKVNLLFNLGNDEYSKMVKQYNGGN